MKKDNILFFILCVAGFLGLVLSYSNHFNNAFQFDDFHTVTDNLFIRDLKNIPLFFKNIQTFSILPGNWGYRPVTTTTLAIDYWLAKGVGSTFYFHLSTFIWYVVQCVLMYFLFLKIMNTASPHRWNRYIALFGVSWYSLHAANAETINYIIQRADSLSTLMVVAGLVLYAYLPGCRKSHVYLIPVIIGVLTKEPAVMFAPLLFLYIMFFEYHCSFSDMFKPRNFIRGMKESLPAFGICILLGFLVLKMLSQSQSVGIPLDSVSSTFSYLIAQPFVMAHYTITFFLPFQLSADTDWEVISSIFDDRIILGFLFVLGMFYIAYVNSKQKERRPIAFGILWFFIALIPTSSFIPLSQVLNDHRMFFPFVGLMLSVCWMFGLAIRRKENDLVGNPFVMTLVVLGVLGILGGHAYGTHERNNVWHTAESLWYDVTIKSPRNPRGLMNYGLTQMAKGNYQRAEEYFEKALALKPRYAYVHINLGILKGATDRPVEAERHFKSALQFNPNDPTSYFYYASWLRRQNREAEAIPLLKRSLQLSPAYGRSQSLLNEILANPKGVKSVVEEAEELARSNPTAENYLRLSLRYHNEGRFEDCIRACNRALEIRPDYELAYNNICSAYNELKMWDKAIEACEKGVRINTANQLLQNNLARAKSQKALQK
jgi:protein O-mannosyl-transferase